MRIFNEKKHNGLEYNYELLYIDFQTYDYGALTDIQYERIKQRIFNDNGWQKRYAKLTRRKFKKYNLSALLALIRLLDVGAITIEEYNKERKKIVVEYKEKSADYYDL